MFENDVTVQPKESSWFGFWDGDTVVPLQQQRAYREDWLGLKSLDKAGRLVFATVPNAQHMQFSLEWFEENVIRPYLAPTPAGVEAGAAEAEEVEEVPAGEPRLELLPGSTAGHGRENGGEHDDAGAAVLSPAARAAEGVGATARRARARERRRSRVLRA